MQVMRFADQLVPASDLDVDDPKKEPTKREIEMASTLVDSLSADFKPGKYKDTYRERVLEVVKRKEKGEEIVLPEPEPEEASDDLLAALEASIKGSSSSSSKRKSSSSSSKAKKKAKA